jgi:hypothetical protein
LDGFRAEQAKSKAKVTQKERKLKKAEKALEAQVGISYIQNSFETKRLSRNQNWRL